MDDVLGDYISRSRLCAENGSNGSRRKDSLLDLQVSMDQIKGVQLLPLIFMKPLNLNVKIEEGSISRF